MPGHVQGHYDGDLRRLIVTLYHRGQMTIPRITTQLRDLGIDIDRRQIRRLLQDNSAADLLGEAQDVLHAGLGTASWVSVDDTGAQHQARNGYCTRMWIGWGQARRSAR
nr:transposase [Rhodovibrio salinarum]